MDPKLTVEALTTISILPPAKWRTAHHWSQQRNGHIKDGACELEIFGVGDQSVKMSPSNRLQNGGGVCGGVGIKYGVEVADIKRVNGLATDLQIFALKTLKIPLPGRHPPSPSPTSSLGKKTPTCRSIRHEGTSTILKPPKEKVSPAMTILQKYYGLSSSIARDTSETELALYASDNSDHSGDDWFPKTSPISDLRSNQYPKSTNLVYDLLTGNDEMHEYVPLADIGDVAQLVDARSGMFHFACAILDVAISLLAPMMCSPPFRGWQD
ncbi:hypothetical protein Ahy_B03g068355 [Arachis hypogaea]|uniref:LysM domain-containing protein n=1 Tax=Arachis hypogaea TaxID=3818 RepID=A0A445A9U0_ARAHY|nr:hypothetical protein Ahy_B03g068355 [Arachis hypogaea]